MIIILGSELPKENCPPFELYFLASPKHSIARAILAVSGFFIVREIGEFNYFAQVGDLCENEHDYLLIGEYNGEFQLNPETGYEAKWIDKQEVLKDMEESPDKYTRWSQESLKVLKQSGFFDLTP